MENKLEQLVIQYENTLRSFEIAQEKAENGDYYSNIHNYTIQQQTKDIAKRDAKNVRKKAEELGIKFEKQKDIEYVSIPLKDIPKKDGLIMANASFVDEYLKKRF